MKKYLLPFNDLTDLKISYNLLKSVHEAVSDNFKEQLDNNNIPYTKSDFGIIIDMQMVPEGYVLDNNADLIKVVYDSLGILKSDKKEEPS